MLLFLDVLPAEVSDCCVLLGGNGRGGRSATLDSHRLSTSCPAALGCPVVVLEAMHRSVDLFDLRNCISIKLTLNININIQLLHFSPIEQLSSEHLCLPASKSCITQKLFCFVLLFNCLKISRIQRCLTPPV